MAFKRAEYVEGKLQPPHPHDATVQRMRTAQIRVKLKQAARRQLAKRRK